jgi:hypothetical protein
VERGLEAYEKADCERQQRRLEKRAAEMGFAQTPINGQTV